jgi:hypothetical protein
LTSTNWEQTDDDAPTATAEPPTTKLEDAHRGCHLINSGKGRVGESYTTSCKIAE